MSAQISFEKGWQQRAARHLLPPGALVDAVNVVPDEEGALKTRLGYTLLGTTPQTDVHSLHTMYKADGTRVRYQGAGTVLHRDFATIMSGLNGDPIEFASMKGNGEDVEYTFFANGEEALRVKDDGTSLTRWGIAAPTIAPSPAVGSTKTQAIETFDSVSIATDFTPTSCTLARDTTNKQEGPSALSMAIVAGQVGFAARTIAPLNLTLFSDGTTATDDDAIRFWISVSGLSNLDGVQLALNYSTGTQLIDGYFITTLNIPALIATDGAWAEVVVVKKDFLPSGTAAGGWGAINGIHFIGVVSAGGNVTLKFDGLRLQGGYGIGKGQYKYKQVFIRKAAVANVYGRWVDATATYTDQTGAPLDVVTTTANNGHLIGGDVPFAEATYSVTTVATGGTPVYEYAYWAGAWVLFTPDEEPVFTSPARTRIRFSFQTGAWQKATPTGMAFSGLANTQRYWIRIRATTPPTLTAGQASLVRVFDAVVAARSNGSPQSSLATTIEQQAVTVTVSNPSIGGADYDPQVTHVEVYRTVANDTDDNATYLYDGDVAVGTSSFVSIQSDAALGEILEIDNDRPHAFTAIMEHHQRIFGLHENHLHFSKVGFPESFPPQNFLPISTVGDRPAQTRQYDGIPYVWTSERLFRILGSDETTYYAQPLQCPTGLGAVKSVERGERGVYFLGRDGNLWRLQGGSAVNISDANHYALFHGVTQNGIAPLNTDQTAQATCVAAWHNLRLYFTYPSGSATRPDTMLVIDERTETWWRDSRTLRCLHYDRQGRQLVGSSGTTGQVFQLDSGTTDNGANIAVIVQTRDEDEQAIEHDKELVQCTVDANTNGVTCTLLVVADYASSGFQSLGTFSSAARQQSVLATAVGTSMRGKALGYRLTGSGNITLYRLIPHALVYPATLRAYRSLPLDMGYPGSKLLESLQLDLDLLSGIMTITLYADGVASQTTIYSTIGRTLRQLIESPLVGTVFQVGITCTGTFLLYPGTATGWIPRPQTLRTYRTPPSDLGYPGPKMLESFLLDIDLQAGSVTVALIADGVTQASWPMSTLGRSLTQLLTTPAQGTIIEVLITVANVATDSFLLYQDTALGWLPTAAPVMRAYRSIPMDLGYPGPKVLESLALDVDLQSGILTIQVYADGALAATLTHATLGRTLTQTLTSTIEATLFDIRLSCTGTFLLYPDTALGWVARPEPVLRVHRFIPTDLGYPGPKVLESLTLDVDLQSGVLTIQVYADDALAATLTHNTLGRRLEQVLTTALTGTLFEVRLSCTGTFLLYPDTALGWVPTAAPVMRTYRSIPLDLGYPGPKVLESFLLDIDLQSGVLTAQVYADGALAATLTHSTLGRALTQILTTAVEGTIFDIRLSCTGTFLLYPDTALGWVARPEPVLRVHRLVATDLGYPGPKVLESLTLDIDLQSGALTIQVYADTVLAATLTHSTLGRSLAQVLTSAIDGTLFEVRLSCTGTFLLYPDTALGWLPRSAPVMRTYRSVPLDLGYPGPKIIESFLLDVDLQSGVLTAQVYTDGTLATTLTYSATGRALTQILTGTVTGTLIEVRLSCTGTFLLYPDTALGWVGQPEPALRTYRTAAFDFGYPGVKTLESFLLDVALASGSIAISIYADGVLSKSLSYSTSGRQLTQILDSTVSGSVFEILLVATDTFQLYPSSILGWLPKPLPLLNHHVQPTDLGYPGTKNPVACYLDCELLSAGVLTVTFLSDGVLTHTIRHTETGRVRSQRHRLPATMTGRLVAVDFSSTAPFLLWPGTAMEWSPLGREGVQLTPLVGQVAPNQQIQQTPLLPGNFTPQLQQTPLLGQGMGGQIRFTGFGGPALSPQLQQTPLLGQGMGGQVHFTELGGAPISPRMQKTPLVGQATGGTLQKTPLWGQEAGGPPLRVTPLPTAQLTQAV